MRFLNPGTYRDARERLDADATEEELQALHEHVLKTSPVGSILTRPLNVTTDLVAGARKAA